MIIRWQVMPAFYVLTNCDAVEHRSVLIRKYKGVTQQTMPLVIVLGTKKLKFKKQEDEKDDD